MSTLKEKIEDEEKKKKEFRGWGILERPVDIGVSAYDAAGEYRRKQKAVTPESVNQARSSKNSDSLVDYSNLKKPLKERVKELPEERTLGPTGHFLDKLPKYNELPPADEAAPGKIDNEATTDNKANKAPPTPKTPEERELASLDNRLKKLISGTEQLEGPNRKYFEDAQADLIKVYKDAQGNLEKRELIEKLGHALTQLGAGMFGLKHGTDMSGLKFDKTDWEKRYQRALDELKLGADGLDKERNRQTDEFKSQQAAREREIGRIQQAIQWNRQHQLDKEKHADAKEQTELLRSLASQKAASDEEKARLNMLEKRRDELVKNVSTIYGDKKTSDEEKASLVKLRIANSNIGISDAEAESIVSSPSWINRLTFGALGGNTPADMSEAVDRLNTALSTRMFKNYLQQPVPETAPPPVVTQPVAKTRIQWHDGRFFDVTPEDMEKLDIDKYKVIK